MRSCVRGATDDRDSLKCYKNAFFLLLCVNHMRQNDNLDLRFFSSYDGDHLVVSDMLHLLNYMRWPRRGIAKVTRSSTSQARGHVEGGGRTGGPVRRGDHPIENYGNFRRMHDKVNFLPRYSPQKYIYTSPRISYSSYVPGTDAVLLHGATCSDMKRGENHSKKSRPKSQN